MAPERIWTNGLGCYGDKDGGGVAYIRADLHATAIAERDAAREALREIEDASGEAIQHVPQGSWKGHMDWIKRRARAALDQGFTK